MTAGHVVVVGPVAGSPVEQSSDANLRYLITHMSIRAGHETTAVPVDDDFDIATLPLAGPGDVIVDLRQERRDPGSTALFERQGFTPVGSGSEAQHRCQDVDEVGRSAARIDVGMPGLLSVDEARDHSGPVVVRQRRPETDSAAYLVDDARSVALELERRGLKLGDVSIEEYVEGPAYTIGVVNHPERGPTALPVVRLRVQRDGNRPIIDKGDHGGIAADSPRRFGLAERAVALFKDLGIHDYACFDFRVVRGRGPVLLAANLLPDLLPSRHLAVSARWAGLTYPDLISQILSSAIDRSRR